MELILVAHVYLDGNFIFMIEVNKVIICIFNS